MRKFGDTHGSYSVRDIEALRALRDPAVRAEAEALIKRFHTARREWLAAAMFTDADSVRCHALDEIERLMRKARLARPHWLALDEAVADIRMTCERADFMRAFDAVAKRVPRPE